MRDLPKLLVLKRFKPSRKHELVVGTNPCNANSHHSLECWISNHQPRRSLPYRQLVRQFRSNIEEYEGVKSVLLSRTASSNEPGTPGSCGRVTDFPNL